MRLYFIFKFDGMLWVFGLLVGVGGIRFFGVVVAVLSCRGCLLGCCG